MENAKMKNQKIWAPGKFDCPVRSAKTTETVKRPSLSVSMFQFASPEITQEVSGL